MAGSIQDLVARFIGDSSSLVRALDAASRSTEDFARVWGRTAQEVSRAAVNVGATIGTLSAGIVAYAARMGTAFNAAKQESEIAFSVLLGSAEKAKTLVADIQTLAAQTPLKSSDINQAAKTLLNYGVAAQSIIPTLKMLGDASGGQSDKFAQMALAYSQASATGKLGGQDLLQFVTAGFSPLQEIAARTGESMSKLKKRMEEGKVSIYELNQAFIDATSEGGRFFGYMEAEGKSFNGMMSTFSDKVEESLGTMFKPMSDSLGKALAYIIGAMENKQVVRWIDQMRDAVAQVMAEISSIAQDNGASAIRSIGDGFLWASRGVIDLLKSIRESTPAITDQIDKWRAFLRPVTDWLAANPQVVAGFVALSTALKAMDFLGMTQAFSSLASTIPATANMIGTLPGLFMSVGGAAGGLGGSLARMGAGFVALPSVISTAMAAMKSSAAIQVFVGDGMRAFSGIIATMRSPVASLVSALSSMSSPLTTLISLVTSLQAALATVKAAAGAAYAAMSGLFLVGGGTLMLGAIAGLAYWMGQVWREAAKANAEFDRMERKASRMLSAKHQDILSYEGKDDAETLAYLKNKRAESSKNLEGLGVQRKLIESGAGNSVGDWMMGTNKKAGDSLDRQEEAEENLASSIDQKIKYLERKATQSVEKVEKSPSAGTIETSPGAGPSLADESNQEKIDKALKQHRDDKLESKFDGYHNVRSFLDMKASPDEVQQFAGSQKGVSPELATEFAQLYAESDKSAESLDQLALALARTVKEQKDFEKRADTVGDKMEDFQEKLNDLRGAVPAKELQGFMQQFNSLGEQFKAEAIDSDQYRDGLKNLMNRVKDAGQVSQQSKSVDGDVSQARRKLLNTDGPEWTGQKAALGMVNDETRRAAFGKLDGIEAESQRLGAAFKSGEISAAQYAAAVDRLKRSTNEVTEAALAEDQAKRRQALLRGDWKGAGLDFGKAVEDKMADQMMSQFQDQVSTFVNNFTLLNGYTQAISQNFDDLSGQVVQFGTNLGKSIGNFFGGGSGNQTDPAAASYFSSWLATTQGMISQLWNAIQAHKQALTLLSDPQRRQQEIDAINSLTKSIQDLNKSVSTFNGYRSYDPIFKDPGITGTGQNTVLNNVVNINAPNMVDASQSALDFLGNHVVNMMARQGNRNFNH